METNMLKGKMLSVLIFKQHVIQTRSSRVQMHLGQYPQPTLEYGSTPELKQRFPILQDKIRVNIRKSALFCNELLYNTLMMKAGISIYVQEDE